MSAVVGSCIYHLKFDPIEIFFLRFTVNIPRLSSAMALSISDAALIGLLTHSALYGIYLVFFIGALYVTYTRRLEGHLKAVNMFLFTGTIVLFLLITANWVIQILRMADAFIYRIDESPDQYYAAKTPKSVTNIALNMSQTIVADSTMVYRFYIVWGRSLRVILLPLVLIIGLIGTGCGAAYSMSSISRLTGQSNFFYTVVSFLGATLMLNLAISGLISYRIWSVNRVVAGLSSRHRTYSVVYILLENAMLYVACVGSALIGVILGDTYQFIVLDTMGPVVGIAFCLIIVWVGLGKGIESTSRVLNDVKFHSNGIPTRNICL
ncbi:hypothetical protein BD779DRAFT_433557 [Infundibulicybe gibba]|nr:hypothetical protein BD779DRAFT_433557 [Infundibulicybe gibba]